MSIARRWLSMGRRKRHAWPHRTESLRLTSLRRAPLKRNRSNDFGVTRSEQGYAERRGTIPMRLSFVRSIVLACLPAAAPSYAQMSTGSQATASSTGTDSMQTELHMLTDVQKQGVDRKEEN